MEAARERESPDVGLVVVTLTLIALGAIIILDASFARALQSRDAQFDAFHYFKRQVLWISLAAPALWVSCQWPYWRLRRWPIWLGGVVLAIILLVVVLIPTVGREGMGSRRWLGFGPARFQPSEFAKVAMVLFLARYSELCRGCIRQLVPGFVLPAGVICVLGALIAVEDLGTAITLVVTGLIMLVMMGAQ
ncbi:MAG: hypothetical protein FJX77_04485, partial [Armatimonadetes bacterium]|nr:hypothetical protein [Armatimonadota bacterium]